MATNRTASAEAELVSNVTLLVIAGHETTVSLIAHSVLILLRNTDALEKPRRRPEDECTKGFAETIGEFAKFRMSRSSSSNI